MKCPSNNRSKATKSFEEVVDISRLERRSHKGRPKGASQRPKEQEKDHEQEHIDGNGAGDRRLDWPDRGHSRRALGRVRSGARTPIPPAIAQLRGGSHHRDRKSTRLNSSHLVI